MVGANTFRNPGLVVKSITTLDHISRRAGHPRHRRGVVRVRAHRPWHRVRAERRRAPGLARRGRRGDANAARWRHGDLAAGRPLRLPGPASRARIRSSRTCRSSSAATVARRPSGRSPATRDQWNGFGTPGRAGRAERGPERLPGGRGSPDDAVERTVNIWMVIRDDPAEARRVWESQQAFNTEPIDEPEIARGRPILGSVEQVAARLREYVDAGLPDRDRRAARAVRPRDDRAPDRRGQAAGRRPADARWRVARRPGWRARPRASRPAAARHHRHQRPGSTAPRRPTSVAPPPSPSPPDLGADLVIAGSGSVPCPIPGCRASVELGPGWRPTRHLTRRSSRSADGRSTSTNSTVGGATAVGPILDAPDLDRRPARTGSSAPSASSPTCHRVHPMRPATIRSLLLGWDLCDAPLTVARDVTSVRIDVAFSPEGGCTVTTGVGIP